MRFLHALAALVLVGSAATLHAEDYQHAKSGLQFTLPKGWKIIEKDEVIVVRNAEGTINIIGGVIEKKDAKEIFDNVEGFLKQLKPLTDPKITGGPKKEKVNGLEQSWYEGTALVADAKGNKVKGEWDLTFITGGKAILFFVGMGQIDDNEKVYESFFESIKKSGDDDE